MYVVELWGEAHELTQGEGGRRTTRRRPEGWWQDISGDVTDDRWSTGILAEKERDATTSQYR